MGITHLQYPLGGAGMHKVIAHTSENVQKTGVIACENGGVNVDKYRHGYFFN